MKVKYSVGDLSFEVNSVEELEKALREFLSRYEIVAPVSRVGDCIVVEYPDVYDIDANEDEQIVISFCKARRFGKAKKVVGEFLDKMRWSSDGYRLLAQILMEEGEVDKAIEQAKVALKFDPGNVYALVLVGNLLSREKKNPKEGVHYYKRAMELDSSSPLAITNYAACLQNIGEKNGEQEQLFRRAIQLAPDFLNAYYGLVIVLTEKGQYREAFDLCFKGLTCGKERPENTKPLRQMLSQKLIHLASLLVGKCQAKSPVTEIVSQIHEIGGCEIRVDEDASLSVPAKVELAKVYGRSYDRLVYRPAQNGNAYFVIHELEKHLMRVESRNKGRECDLMTLPSSEALFKEKTLPYVTDRIRNMFSGSDLDGFLDQMMTSMCGQLMNCPLDLFVEKRIFDKYTDQRPEQILGVFENIKGYLESVKAGEKGMFPKNVVRINRLLNGVAFLQFRDLLGLDFLGELHLDDDEYRLAWTYPIFWRPSFVSRQPIKKPLERPLPNAEQYIILRLR